MILFYIAMVMAKYHLVIYREGRWGYDHTVVGCAIIYEISAYHQ
jgi:hypothetical protein